MGFLGSAGGGSGRRGPGDLRPENTESGRGGGGPERRPSVHLERPLDSPSVLSLKDRRAPFVFAIDVLQREKRFQRRHHRRFGVHESTDNQMTAGLDEVGELL